MSRPARGARRRARRGGRPAELVPDILYHATTTARIAAVRGAEALEAGRDQRLFLSVSEEQAWRVAHRQPGDPAVLVVDAARARRDGVRFQPVRPGLWQTQGVPTRHVLNLHPAYGEQASAGGVLLWEGPDGPELAMICVTRRFGSTWEVAKGKMEPGETPTQAALRELSEEMGLPAEAAARLEVIAPLGAIRYGFQTPAGEPRLKTLHLFLIAAHERIASFTPARAEGIVGVEWLHPVEAARRVHHRSLKPLMEEVSRRLTSPRAGEEDASSSEDEPSIGS